MNIQSSIMLHDRMTQNLTRVISAVDTTITTLKTLDNTNVSPNISLLNDASAQIALARSGMEQTAENSAVMNRNLTRTPGILNNILDKVKTIGAAFLAAFALKNIIKWSDEQAQINAKINLISDNPQDVKEKVLASAQDSRSDYGETMNNVAKMGLLTGNTFVNTDEIIAFNNLLAKTYKIAGTGTQEQIGSMRQLTQALASGRLQGDEYVSVLENAPMVAHAIAKELGVTIGEMKKLSSDGKITADIIKRAVFNAADDINGKFEQIPLTWRDIWQRMVNVAKYSSDGILNKINQIANTQTFKDISDNFIRAMNAAIVIANGLFNTMVSGAKFIKENWALISPVIYGVTTALGAYLLAQGAVTAVKGIAIAAEVAHGFAMIVSNLAVAALAFVTGQYAAAQTAANAALYAFPVTWVVAAIITIIVGLIALTVAMVKWGTKTATVAGTVMGIFYAVGAVVYNVAAAIVNTLVGAVNDILRNFNHLSTQSAKVASGIANVFIKSFNAMARVIAEILNSIFANAHEALKLVDMVAGTSFAGEGPLKINAIQKGLVTYEGSQAGLINGGNDQVMQYKSVGGAYGAGVAEGNRISAKISKGVEDMKSKMDEMMNGIANNDPAKGSDPNGKNTAKNTDKMAKKLEASEEDLKYLRDIAEQEYINRFTTAEVKIDMANNATINTTDDIDGIWKVLVDGANEALETIAEGSYN